MNKCSQIILSSLLCGCWMQTLAAAHKFQEVSFMRYSTATDIESEPKNDQTVQANHLNIRQIEGKGIGYTRGYTTLETFFTPFYNFESYLPFFDLRAHRFDDGKYAFNTGLGFRYFATDKCRIWGVNAYYDYRQTHQKNYKQIGVGIESLGRFWDYRVNGYIPFGKHKSSRFDLDFDRFSGHNFFVKYKHEFAMTGADAEAAYHWMPSKNIDITAAAGPYYFQGHYNEFATGGKIRAKARFLKAISLEGIASYDNLFKWNGQGQLTFSIPLGPKLKDQKIPHSCRSYADLEQRLVQPVERDEIIVAAKHTGRQIAIDPLTGLPFNIMFVDNDPVLGDGTFESRFLTLADAQTASRPHDIIYVFAGDGTTTGMDAGFVMQDFQKIFGSGIKQQVQTTLGKVKLPALSSAYPALNNASGSDYIVQMANNCEVSGIYFPATDTAEFGGAIRCALITNGVIKNNIINLINTDPTNKSTKGIILANDNGTISVTNNRVTSLDSNPNIGFTIVNILAATPALCTYSIIDNFYDGAGAPGVGFHTAAGLFVYNDAGVPSPNSVTILFQENSVLNSREGIHMDHHEHAGANLTVNCSNNLIEGIIETPALFVASDGSFIDLIFDQNILRNNTADPSVPQILTVKTLSGGSFIGQINSNFFQGNTTDFSLHAETDAATSMCLQVNNNSFDLPVNIDGTAGTLNIEIPVGNTYPSFTNTGNIVPAGTCE